MFSYKTISIIRSRFCHVATPQTTRWNLHHPNTTTTITDSNGVSLTSADRATTKMAARTIAASLSSSLFEGIRRATPPPSPLIRRRRSFSSESTLSTTTKKKEQKIGSKMSDRLSAVIDAVNERKLPPELRGQRGVKSETDIINVVERRIWKSMEEGHFENLPGKGKPLDLSTNPHADPAEDTLYRILSKNGCAPEWVELNKEIRTRVAEWRSSLRKAWTNKCDGYESKWIESSESLKAQIRDINNMVFRYNLIVPFGRQMFGIKWEKEVERVKES